MNMFLQTSTCIWLEEAASKWGKILLLNISFTISEGNGIVKALGEASAATMFLLLMAGDAEEYDDVEAEEEEEEELVTCEYASARL